MLRPPLGTQPTTGQITCYKPGQIICSQHSGMPQVADYADVEYVKASDEHGVLHITGATRLSLGDKLKLIPGHCDPTVNLYDEFVCIRGGRVEALWPITARGALL